MPRTFTMPKNRAPIRPGEILEEEYRIPLGLTQQQFADALGIDRERYSAVATGRRRVTPGTAIRLAKVLGTSVELWLNMQMMCDLYEAQHGEDARAARSLKPLLTGRGGKGAAR